VFSAVVRVIDLKWLENFLFDGVACLVACGPPPAPARWPWLPSV